MLPSQRYYASTPTLGKRCASCNSAMAELFVVDVSPFTLPNSPQKNGIAERRIGLVMEVARTFMIQAAAPHFLWLFAVRYAAHQLNLWPRVSLPETPPTLRWTGEVGDASVFRVWGSRAFVRDTSADKISVRAIPCVFVGFVPYAPGWQFYHPTSRRVFPSQDVTFDESVLFYHLFPYCSAPPPPPQLILAPNPPPVDPLPPQGPAPSDVSQVDLLHGNAPVEVAVGSGAARGAASRGAEPRGAGSEGAGSRGAEPEGVEPGGADSGGCGVWGLATGAGGTGYDGAGGAGATVGAGGTGGTAAAGPGGARMRGAGAAGTGGVEGAGAADPTEPGAARAGGSCAGGAGAGGAGAGGAGVGGTSAGGVGAARAGAVDRVAGGAGGTMRPRPYFVPLLQQILSVPSSTSLTPPLQCSPPDQSLPPLLTASPLPAPSPYTEQSGGLTERRVPASLPVSHVRTARRVPPSRPPPVPGTHDMALCPSSVPLHIPLPAPRESSLPEIPAPEFDRAHAASPTVSRLLATVVTDPSFESAAASTLVAKLLDFAAACRLDSSTALAAECLAAPVPCFASMLLAPEGEAITGPYSS
ncbi:unnamed protein product [Closterium sp. NIES-54]